MRSIAPLIVLALGSGIFATSANAQAVTVLGGGMARECSQAALSGESNPRFEEVCTEALNTELLGPTDRAGTFVNRGVLKLRRKDFSGAEADFNRALQTKGDLAEAYVNRGAAAVGARRYAEGLADINKALELGVQEPEKAYYNRALAHEGLDDMKAAYFDYRKAIELKPDWPMPRQELARFTVERR